MAMIDAQRALALAGVSFRAQGRDPASGLDCVGLTLIACDLTGIEARRDYRLRGEHRAEILRALAPHFWRVSPSRRRVGDVMLMRVGEGQWHLAIHSGRGFVHADARLRRVVETPGDPAWSVAWFRRRRHVKVEG